MTQEAAPAPRFRKLKIAAIVVLALLVFGAIGNALSGSDDDRADEPATSTETTPTLESTPEPTTEPTSEPVPEPPAEPAAVPDEVSYPIDRWPDVVDPAAEWAPWVVTAQQTEENRIVITTLITDPRGEDGSVAALHAIAICESAVAVLEADGVEMPAVSVMESDDTTFVMYTEQDPAPAGMTAGQCTEY
jgi:hypothetical protein